MLLRIALILAVAFIGCGERKGSISETALPVQKVKVATLALKPMMASEEVPGSVRARLRATIEAKVSGRITNMLAVEGQAVEAGQLLAELDVQEIKARLDQALAVTAQAERDVARYSELLRKNATSRAEYEAADAKAGVARAAAAEAQTMLGYARITAPFKGIITRKLSDVGDLAAPGKPLLEIEDPTSLRFEANLPESFVEKAVIGAHLPVRIPNLDKDLDGIISEIAPTTDPNSRTFMVKLDLPAETQLRSGQFGHVAVPLRQRTVLEAPASALIKRGQMEIIFVVQDGKAALRLVRTEQKGANVELLAGASPGERIVISNISALRDGQPLEVE